MKIFLGYDNKCLSKEKIISGRIGGTERFFLLLESYLQSQGHTVNSSNEYDIAIHSNWMSTSVNTTYQVCWCGSWTTDACDSKYNLVIANSQFMLDKLKIKGTVIPACYDSKIVEFESLSEYTNKKIITTSNPNRHFFNTLQVIDLLHKSKADFSWLITGGNKLYSDSFSEQFQVKEDSSIAYRGILNREDMLKELATSHVFCYPNFTDNSETQCVAMIEASVLGVPVILPKRQPFTDTLPDNPYFVNNINECAEVIINLLDQSRQELKICDVSNYTEDVVFNQIHEALLLLGN